MWRRKIQANGELIYGGDDEVNLRVPQRTVLPLIPVHFAVVKSESADFEAGVTTSSAGYEMRQDTFHLHEWNVWIREWTEEQPVESRVPLS